VAEARRDLEIAIEPRRHQELLELLRRLRQGVELAGVHPARHQVAPRPFRRARGQDRGLELGETGLDHATANRRDDAASEHDVAVKLLTPQVEESVTQPCLLGKLGVAVDLERQRIRDGLHGQLGDRQLDLAGRQLWIDGGRRARDDLAADGDHALEAQRLGGLEQRARAVEHALRDPVVVAQIDEEEIAVIALAMQPAREPNRLPGMLASKLAARMSPEARHRGRSPSWPPPPAALSPGPGGPGEKPW